MHLKSSNTFSRTQMPKASNPYMTQPPTIFSRRLTKASSPKALAQILLDHGWGINERSPGSKLLLWPIVNDDDAVAWCLERGASVLLKG